MSTNVVVTATTYQHNGDGKALTTGVGFRIESNKTSDAKCHYDESTTDKYSALVLKNVVRILQGAHHLGQHDNIRFITGMPDVAGVLRKINKAFIECVKSKVTTEEHVDRIMCRVSNYERRANHELYVAVAVEAVVLSNNGVNVEFYPDYIRTVEHGELWSETKKRVIKSPSLKNSS